jgi:hypothetical protein
LTPKVNLYSEGIKTKFYQARWSLNVLREIEHAPNVEGSTTSQEAWNMISTNDKIVFFCECFWDFLRSSIDIASQLINELRLQPLKIDEEDVSFYKVRDKMEPSMSTTLLFKALESCRCSWAFKELNSYRHCSTHRRQVCIFEVPSSPSPLTRGYEYMSGSTTRVMNRYLCSNPGSLRPRMSLKRPVVAHNEKILNEIEKHLSTIVKRLP